MKCLAGTIAQRRSAPPPAARIWRNTSSFSGLTSARPLFARIERSFRRLAPLRGWMWSFCTVIANGCGQQVASSKSVRPLPSLSMQSLQGSFGRLPDGRVVVVVLLDAVAVVLVEPPAVVDVEPALVVDVLPPNVVEVEPPEVVEVEPALVVDVDPPVVVEVLPADVVDVEPAEVVDVEPALVVDVLPPNVVEVEPPEVVEV